MKKLMILITSMLAIMVITACHGPHGRFDSDGGRFGGGSNRPHYSGSQQANKPHGPKHERPNATRRDHQMRPQQSKPGNMRPHQSQRQDDNRVRPPHPKKESNRGNGRGPDMQRPRS
ncbi:MAG TPA: hypothetical protein DD638_07755 [Pasteurellaceae bacterium]|nr:hypothetical protein [Pasteurellaceae bacterium]